MINAQNIHLITSGLRGSQIFPSSISHTKLGRKLNNKHQKKENIDMKMITPITSEDLFCELQHCVIFYGTKYFILKYLFKLWETELSCVVHDYEHLFQAYEEPYESQGLS